MGVSEAYDAFAYAYDKGLGARFFDAIRPLLDEQLEKYPTPKRTHLDVACGTGLALDYFRSRGWKSTGVDASLSMLQLARGRSPRVAAGDFRALPFRTKFARITCLYDSLNHLLEREDLVAAYAAVRGVMDHDSLFLFDMNHPDIYPTVWGLAEPYVASGDDYHLEIATTYRKRERAARALVTGWAVIHGQRAVIDETHRQRAWSEREITRALDDAGLAPVDIIDFDPFQEAEEIDGGGVKLVFVCRPK